jgi:hypothetical protein
MANLVGQPAPDGAYVVGGSTASGSAYSYGQGVTQDAATSLINPMGSLLTAMEGGVTGALGLLEQILLTLPLDALKLFMPLVNGVLGDFVSVASAASAIVGSLIVKPVMATVQDVLDLINKFLAPLGTVATTLEEAFSELALVATSPWQVLTNLQQHLEDLFDTVGGMLGDHQAQISQIRLQLDAGASGVAAYDNCKTATNVTPVGGTTAFQPTGWGAWDCSALGVSHYNTSPTTDRHGSGILVKNKRVGITRTHICSNDAMTSFAALELNVQTTGSDLVSVVTGTGPNSGFISRMSLETRISANTFWQIYYEPYDETSPTSNTFHVFCNKLPVVALQWNDQGNAVLHGPDYLRVGATINGSNHATHRGFLITRFAFDDWLDASPQ